MKKIFEDKKVLITGGTGSIGKAITFEILKYNPRSIRIFDSNENSQFLLQGRLKDYGKIMRFLIGDVRDKERLRRAIEDIDIVFHTAGLKHVLSCEYNPFEAVKTNILGTQNLIDVALEEEVEKVIFTSSDKAVNPSSTMGASKLLAEKLIISANYYRGKRKTAFACVRFGNVMGSSGSALPLFKSQIKKGGPVTLTDESMTRLVLSPEDAMVLIFDTAKLMQGGEIFISKMPALRILDLIELLIEELAPKYGFDPEKIQVKTVGIKPGEKLFEELITEDEARRTLDADRLFIVTPELKRYAHFNESHYKNAFPTKLPSYSSKSGRMMSKKEIKDFLVKENLLD
ncbi:MAG: SDR family NAD(P)-dependent oxidoreductase [Candidatus Hodarchaeales archaeon]|jgi:FlaA1/EpsC-like NDP-sugar epimerase